MKNLKVLSKSERKDLVARKLWEAGVSSTGRQVRISRETGISKPVVQALLLGSMPRDQIVCLTFCETYGIDFKEWVTGSKEPEDSLVEAIALTRDFERQSGVTLSNEKFSKLVNIALKDGEQAKTLVNTVIEFGSE